VYKTVAIRLTRITGGFGSISRHVSDDMTADVNTCHPQRTTRTQNTLCWISNGGVVEKEDTRKSDGSRGDGRWGAVTWQASIRRFTASQSATPCFAPSAQRDKTRMDCLCFCRRGRTSENSCETFWTSRTTWRKKHGRSGLP
jgi:hypothetical protein